MIKRIISALFACFLLCVDVCAEGVSGADRITAFQLEQGGFSSVQDWADSLKAGSEWYVFALRRYPVRTELSAYANALEADEKLETKNPATRKKYALALIAAGKGESPYISAAADEPLEGQGIMSLVFELHLLNNGAFSEKNTPGAVIEAIAAQGLSDGGWAVSGERSDADVTAMTLQALAPHYDENAALIDGALEFLSEAQLPDGGFQSYGTPNAESAAQVIAALCSLGIDPLTDERFIKNGNTIPGALEAFRLPDGSFSHEKDGKYSPLATAQAFAAFVSLETKRPLFIFEEEQTAASHENTEAAAPVETEKAADTESPAAKAKSGTGADYKPAAFIITAGAALLACLVLVLTKKAKPKNLAFIALAATAAGLFIGFTDLQSADSYYTGENLRPDEIYGSARIAVYCDTIAGEAEHIPSDGVILAESELPFGKDASVLDVLISAAKKYGLKLGYSGTKELAYVESIQSISELDFGGLSGWMYFVNGESPSVGCGEYRVSDGDLIEFRYTRDTGNDLMTDSGGAAAS